MTTLREARRQLQAARVTMTVSDLGIQSHPYDGGRWVPWDAADDLLAEVAGAAECVALRGQRDVLVRLLIECDSLIDSIEPESSDESIRLELLLTGIREAVEQIANEKLESTHD